MGIKYSTSKYPTDMSTPNTTSAIVADNSMTKELLAAGKAIGQPIYATHDAAPVVIIPDGYRAEQLDFAPIPDPLPYVAQNVHLNDTESFVMYVKRYQTPSTLLFATLPQNADGSGAEFRAVFDYHNGGKGSLPEGASEHPSARCAHQAIYPCPLSESWKNWTRQNGKGLTQTDFINFIEANSIDIVTPDAATVMELAVSFESKTEVTFTSKIDRLSGAKMLNFTEEVSSGKSGGKLKVPDSLKLRLPVFDGGKPFEITARLEWRPANGKLSVTFHLQQQSAVIRQALQTVREEIGKDIGIVPLTGRLG